MLVDKQSELKSDFLFTVHRHDGDDVTWKPPILKVAEHSFAGRQRQLAWRRVF